MTTYTQLRLAVISLLALAAQGCAVLTIDVDVYKGPLLNQRSVQMEQVISLASAAKPLLVALREQVENKAREEKHDNTPLDKDLFPGENPLGYLSLISPRTKALRFYSKPAMHINEILGLYSPDSDPAIARMIQDFQIGKTQFHTAKQRFARAYTNEASQWLPETTPTNQTVSDDVRQKIKTLRAAYISLLTINCEENKSESAFPRCVNTLMEAHNSYAETLLTVQTNTSLKKIETGTKPKRIAVPTFAALRDRSVVAAHAELLGIKQTYREAFIDTVTSIANDFFAMADAQADMWHTTLPLLIRATPPQTYSSRQPVSPKEQALDRAREYIVNTTAIRILHCAVTVVPPKQLAAGDIPEVPVGWAGRLKDVFLGTETISSTESPCALTWGRYQETFRTSEINEHLFNMLREEPGQTVRDLLDADAYAQHSSRVNENIDRRPYGIVLIPEKHDDTSLDKNDNIIERYSSQNAQTVGNLQDEGLSYRGLIPGGLDTLLKEYIKLRIAYPLDTNSGVSTFTAVREKQEALLHVLVHFSNSLLTTANYIKLLNKDGQNRCWTFLAVIRTAKCPADHDLDEYVSVLQAIGNSILFQVDEIRRRDIAESRLNGSSNKAILPMPAAYLRSSIPATTLQAAPKNLGANMLDELKSSLEEIRRLIVKTDTEDRNLLLEELDKQSWQRVNQIKVRGVGRTNYVVAKDDIGNWYVKNFTSDPEEIIKSAGALAKFGLTGGLSVGHSATKDVLLGLKAEDQTTLASNLITGATANVKTELDNIKSQVGQRDPLKSDLITSLEKDPILQPHSNTIEDALKPIVSTTPAPAVDDCRNDLEAARDLCNELQSTHGYTKTILDKLLADSALSSATHDSGTKPLNEKAREQAATFFQEKFRDWIKQTNQALDRYKMALSQLSE